MENKIKIQDFEYILENKEEVLGLVTNKSLIVKPSKFGEKLKKVYREYGDFEIPVEIIKILYGYPIKKLEVKDGNSARN